MELVEDLGSKVNKCSYINEYDTRLFYSLFFIVPVFNQS